MIFLTCYSIMFITICFIISLYTGYTTNDKAITIFGIAYIPVILALVKLLVMIQ